MDISQLRSFVAVAEAGSYIKASDLLSVPQPTLSRQVRTLELELRASLFHRHGRGVRLTDKGGKFIEYARSVIHTMDAALLSVRDSEAVYTGHLIVGLTPSIGRILIPALAPLLKEKFPLASVRLTEGLSGALYEKVLLGQVDFALVLSPASSPHLHIEPLATEQLYLIGPQPVAAGAAHIDLQDLVQLPLILPHSNQWTRPALETAAARLGLRLRIELEIDSTASTMEVVAGGGGYSIMPGSLRKLKTLPPLSWQKIVGPPLEATISMISSTKQPHSQLSDAAALVVRDALKEIY
jgi:LysR family nitrogen assimilation transcriptional regulator